MHTNHAEAIFTSDSKSYRLPALRGDAVQVVSSVQVADWVRNKQLVLYDWPGTFTAPPRNCAGDAGAYTYALQSVYSVNIYV